MLQVIERGARSGWVAAVVAGAILAGITLIVPILLDDSDALAFLAVLLGLIGGVYLGFALMDGRQREFWVELVGVALFVALPMIALATAEPLVLAAGYVGHALWDAIHHPRGVHTRIPGWYVPACLGFDVLVGLYIMVRFL